MCDVVNFVGDQSAHMFFWKEKHKFYMIPAGITCSKSIIELLKQGMKYV